MWENALNRYYGDESKCRHPAHQSYQRKNPDMCRAQASLRRYLVDGSKIIQKNDPLSGSTQANESGNAMNGKYTDKRLNFTASTEARFDLGTIFSPNRGTRAGKTSYANLRTFPHSRQNAVICSGTWNQNINKKMRKGERNPKEERGAKPKMSRKQKPVGRQGRGRPRLQEIA
jgi:hypothetical protein